MSSVYEVNFTPQGIYSCFALLSDNNVTRDSFFPATIQNLDRPLPRLN